MTAVPWWGWLLAAAVLIVVAALLALVVFFIWILTIIAQGVDLELEVDDL